MAGEYINEYLDVGKTYKSASALRDEANSLYEKSYFLFDQSQVELNNGDIEKAEELMHESEVALTEAEKISRKSVKEVFHCNNPNKFSNILDFQGLHVGEGEVILKSILIESIGIRNEVTCVVGKKSSKSRRELVKFRQLIEKVCQDSSLRCSDSKDKGSVIIDLRGAVPAQFPEDWKFANSGKVQHFPNLKSEPPKNFWEKAWAGYGMRSHYGGYAARN